MFRNDYRRQHFIQRDRPNRRESAQKAQNYSKARQQDLELATSYSQSRLSLPYSLNNWLRLLYPQVALHRSKDANLVDTSQSSEDHRK